MTDSTEHPEKAARPPVGDAAPEQGQPQSTPEVEVSTAPAAEPSRAPVADAEAAAQTAAGREPVSEPAVEEAPVAPTPALARAQAAPDRNERREQRSLLALALPVAALVIGLAGLGLAGWTLKQLEAVGQQAGSSEQQLAGALEQARVIAGGNDEALRQIKGQLAALPDFRQLAGDHRLLIDLQQTQQKLSLRVDEVLGASRREWKLAEAEHLLRLASLRLSALQDINSALALVEAADGILRDQDDPSSFAARSELARALEGLRLLQPVDRTGLFLKLAALGEQVGKANTRNPEFVQADPEVLAVDAGQLERWWNSLSRYVRLDIAADDEIRPLLMGKTLEHLRLALRLNLEQAQWAALNGRPEVYRAALGDARQLLEKYFGLDLADNQALHARLGELEKLPVEQKVPDLAPALNALQAYLAQRAHADVQALEARQKAEVPKAAAEGAVQ